MISPEIPRVPRISFENNFDIEFHEKRLLEIALGIRAHRSIIISSQRELNGIPKNMTIRRKTLAAIGDALLRLLSIEYESDFRTAVKYQTNSHLASRFDALNLQQYINKKPHELKKHSAKGNVVEAIIGAIYLDQGMEKARAFFRRHIVS